MNAWSGTPTKGWAIVCHQIVLAVSFKCRAAGTNPDTLPVARIRGNGSGDGAFKTQLVVDIAPGRIATLASPGREALVLRFP